MQAQDRCRQQFELEKTLRAEILQSARKNRAFVIASAYRRLFSTFPDHSVFEATQDKRLRKGKLSAGLIVPLLPKSGNILEVGCGRGDTLRVLKSLGYHCVGVEPSAHMLDMSRGVDLEVRHGTAEKLDFPDNCFDVVFCQEVLEHLHPDDAPLFFQEAFRVLKSGGIFSLETPNKSTGPQDISRGFTSIAQGLHLKEWTVSELIEQFLTSGFKNVRGVFIPQFLARRFINLHRMTHVPAKLKWAQDILLRCVPCLRLRTFIGKCIGLDDIYLFGSKP